MTGLWLPYSFVWYNIHFLNGELHLSVLSLYIEYTVRSLPVQYL
jgi:hypothetical protein